MTLEVNNLIGFSPGLAGAFYETDFDNIDDWTDISLGSASITATTEDSRSVMRLNSPGASGPARAEQQFDEFAAELYIEFTAKFNAQNSTNDFFSFLYQLDGTDRFQFIWGDDIGARFSTISGPTYSPAGNTSNNVWYTWGLNIYKSGGVYVVDTELDGVSQTTGQTCTTTSSPLDVGYCTIRQNSDTSGRTSFLDNFKIERRR